MVAYLTVDRFSSLSSSLCAASTASAGPAFSGNELTSGLDTSCENTTPLLLKALDIFEEVQGFTQASTAFSAVSGDPPPKYIFSKKKCTQVPYLLIKYEPLSL